jgi:hypothetical protein
VGAAGSLLRFAYVLFFKFGGLSTLLRKACGGQASEGESSVDIGVHPHGGHLESGIANPVSVGIDQHQAGRAGGRLISQPIRLRSGQASLAPAAT